MRRPGSWVALGVMSLGAILLGAAGCGSGSGSAGASGSSAAPAGSSVAHVQGGTLRMAIHGGIDFIDPALAYYQTSWQIEYATCVKLLNYPDKSGQAGLQLQPEAASSMPVISGGGKTVTFTVPPGRFKFDTGEPVTAATFYDALRRDLNPKEQSPFAPSFMAPYIVGAASWKGTGKLAGVQLSGDKLILHLTKPNATIIPEMATPFMCAVPKNTPVNSKGVNSIAGAGPYYIASYTPNKSLVLKRNPYYHGPRPHYVSQMDFSQMTIDQNQGTLELKNGQLDYCPDCVPAAQTFSLNQQFGPKSAAARGGDQRFFITPEAEVDYYALNTSRKTFANPYVRQAVNYAIDRAGMAKQLGYGIGTPTDKYLPPAIPGSAQEQSIYPLTGPNLAKAKALMAKARAQGVKTPLKALVYSTSGCSQCTNRMAILTQNLKAIGIDVQVKYFERSVQFQQEGVKGAPMDISDEGWLMDFPDAYDFINVLLNGEHIPAKNGDNFAYFDSPTYNKLEDQAAQKTGSARTSAYGRLATQISKNAAPWAAWDNENLPDLFGPRVGCQIFQPDYGFDLASFCIRK